VAPSGFVPHRKGNELTDEPGVGMMHHWTPFFMGDKTDEVWRRLAYFTAGCGSRLESDGKEDVMNVLQK